MIDIYEVSLLDILPPNLKQDHDMIAAAKAVDNDFSLLVNDVKQCILLPRIEEIDDNNTLDLLAWQMHVDFYDSTLPIETKQQLIKNSNNLHRTKGTPAAVEKAAKIVFGRSWIDEWFDYGGNPYYFKVNVEATNRGASKNDLDLLERLIEAYKNKRSWLEVINIFLTSYGQAYFCSCITSGEEIKVFPWQITEIENVKQVNLPVGHISGENVTIYPKEG